MDDLISRQMAIEGLGEEPLVWDEYTDEWELAQRTMWRKHFKLLRELPAAQERKTGKWLQNISKNYTCSICGTGYPEDITDEINFCPNCGAQMEVQ